MGAKSQNAYIWEIIWGMCFFRISLIHDTYTTQTFFVYTIRIIGNNMYIFW